MEEVVEVIDRGAAQITLVIDAERRLLGTVTDGDIRRALLRGMQLNTPVDRIMHRDFRVLPASATEKEALALMRRETLHQIPALDEQGRVVRLFLLEELIKPKARCNPVVIMAGGKGQRLRPLTENCPKPMLRVGGKPLLEIILEQCIEAGFQDFYLAVNYLKEQIQDHFGDGKRWQARIHYLEEDQPLGTAGALSLIPRRPSEPLLVLNGDVLTRVDYSRLLRFHAEHAAAATLCVREHSFQSPHGVAETDGPRMISLREKPTFRWLANAGVYCLDGSVLSRIPSQGPYDMPELLASLASDGEMVGAYPIHEYWLDIGRPPDFESAQTDFGAVFDHS